MKKKKKEFKVRIVGEMTPEKAEKFAEVYYTIAKDQEKRSIKRDKD